MRAFFLLLPAFLLLVPAAALAADGPVVTPADGSVVPVDRAPSAVTITFPSIPLPSLILVLDERGREVPGIFEAPRATERVFRPDSRPLPPGQYTVAVPGSGESRTFTVGPDVYPPRVLARTTDGVRRDEALSVTFTEPIDARTVNIDTVRVFELTAEGPRRVTGALTVDRGGTRLYFTPLGWPGFAPGGTFVLDVADGAVTDLAGNPLAGEDPVFRGAAGEPEPAFARVPEAVYWSSRMSFGVVDLSLGSRDTFDMRSAIVGDPTELVLDPRVDIAGEGLAFGINPRENRVLVIDAGDGEVLRAMPFARPAGLAIHPSGRRLYVTTRRSRELRAFDTTDCAPGRHVPPSPAGVLRLPGRARGVAVSPDGGLLACVLPRSDRVVLAATEPLEVVRDLPTGRRPVDAAFLRDGSGGILLLTTSRGRRRRDGSVLVFDARTGERVAAFEGLRRPSRIAGRGDRAFVAEEGADRILVIRAGAGGPPVIADRIPAGRRPVDVAVAPDGSDRLFVVNGRRGTITVVRTTTHEILAVLPAKGALAVAAVGER